MPAFVLRVLLCISLVFGGMNSAAAAVHAQLTAVQPVPLEPISGAQAGDADAPCHDVAPAMDVASPLASSWDSRTADAGTSDGESGSHGAKCCEPGQCEGACVQLAQAALWFRGFAGSVAPAAVQVSEFEPAHVAPRPQRRIRPPIG